MISNQDNSRTNCMFKFGVFFFTMLVLLLSISGCEDSPTEVEDYDPEPVLTCFLYNGEPVGTVYLERVGSLNSWYGPSENHIFYADIILFPVDNPSAGDTLHFREVFDPDVGWIYSPMPNETLIPQSFVRYRIEARNPSEDLYVWAETTVPDTFTLTVSPYTLENDTIPIPLDWNDPPIRLDWTTADSAAGYVYNSLLLDPYPWVQLDPEMWEEDPGILEIEVLNFGANAAEVPWFSFNWVGLHIVEFQAGSLEYIEYCESIYSANNIDPISNINGGVGIFGGISRQNFYLYMQRVQ